jgi:hypothetical protein
VAINTAITTAKKLWNIGKRCCRKSARVECARGGAENWKAQLENKNLGNTNAKAGGYPAFATTYNYFFLATFFLATFFLAFFFAAIIDSLIVNLGIVLMRLLFRTTSTRFSRTFHDVLLTVVPRSNQKNWREPCSVRQFYAKHKNKCNTFVKFF